MMPVKVAELSIAANLFIGRTGLADFLSRAAPGFILVQAHYWTARKKSQFK
jgi:hypothetical protein